MLLSLISRGLVRPDSLAAAKMMAPGLWVAYKLPSAQGLSWGVGVCDEVKDDSFRIKVFSPFDPTVTVAPWGIWDETDETKEFSLSDTCWMKINKLTNAGKIRTKTLHKIRKDGRFGWEWVAQLDMTVPVPTRVEINGEEEKENRFLET